MPVGHVGTSDDWRKRRELLLRRARVHHSLDELIEDAKSNTSSLAVFKPAPITDFTWETADREWDPAKLKAFRAIASQPSLFDDESNRDRKPGCAASERRLAGFPGA